MAENQQEMDNKKEIAYKLQLDKVLPCCGEGKNCSATTINILDKIKTQRERCTSEIQFRNIEKLMKKHKRLCMTNGKFSDAFLFMFELVSTAMWSKQKDKALVRLSRLQTSVFNHGVHSRLVRIGLNRILFYDSYLRMDIDRSMKCLEEMCSYLSVESSGYEIHMVNYGLGSFLRSLLTLDLSGNENNLKLIDTVQVLHQRFSYGNNVHLGKIAYSLDKPKNLFQSINWVRQVSFEAFRLAREGLIREEDNEDKTSDNLYLSMYYKDPAEKIYSLLSMAKVKLDFPECNAGQKRLLVTCEDISQAESCLKRAEEELQEITSVPRIIARLNICKAGLNLRKYQLKRYKQGETKAKHFGLSSPSVHTRFESVTTGDNSLELSQNFLSDAIQEVEMAYACVKGTSFDEMATAGQFLKYLKEIEQKNKTQAAKVAEDNDTRSNILDVNKERISDTGSSSSSIIDDDQAYLRDLGSSSGGPAESNESDVTTL